MLEGSEDRGRPPWRWRFNRWSGGLLVSLLALASPVIGQEGDLSATCALLRAGDRVTVSLAIVNRAATSARDVAGTLEVAASGAASAAVLVAPRPWRELLPGRRVQLRWSLKVAGSGRLEIGAGATARGGGMSGSAARVACGAIVLAPAATRTPSDRPAPPTATRTPAGSAPRHTPTRTASRRPTRTPAASAPRHTPTRTATQRPTRTPLPESDRSLDLELAAALRAAGVTALDPGPRPRPELVELGRALMFDKLLSGNRDISCATCHHPSLATGDGRSLPVGTGGRGLGPARRPAAGRPLVPRNATELFNRGAPQWRTMFWDMRLTGSGDSFRSPAGAALPRGLDGVLAAQAMFPVTSRDEMRGRAGDRDVYGAANELAALADDDFAGIWQALMRRLRATPGYVALFARAYPGVAVEALGFEHAANALAAFQRQAWTLLGSPWDRYLAGERTALSSEAKRGALLFLGAAGCATCHSGSLFTDQRSHVLAVPQVGPGKGAAAPLDLGRAAETGSARDRFAFRTPPLRNVAVTGPWMHDGAFATLEGAVRHHLDPAASLATYDVRQLDRQLWGTLRDDPATHRALLAGLAPELGAPRRLSELDVNRLLVFLEALTDPAALDGGPVPRSVPSGLPVRD